MPTTAGTPYWPTFSNVAAQIIEPALNGRDILLAQFVLGDAAVHLERADRGHDDHGVGLQAGLAAFDVEKLLGAQVGPEAGLRNDVIGQL